MRRFAPLSLAFGMLACAASGALVIRADAADTPSKTPTTATIDFRVLCPSDDIRFYVDGQRVPARKRKASWHATRASFAVRPGEHTVEAQFRPKGATDETPWSSITTRAPLIVSAGAQVRLDADVRDVRVDGGAKVVRHFDVLGSPSGDASVAHASTDAVPVDAKAEPTSADLAAAGLLGGAAAATTTAEPASVPSTITIHGDEVLSDGRTTTPATTSAEGPLLIGPGLVDDTPAVSDLPKGDATPAATDALAAGHAPPADAVDGSASEVAQASVAASESDHSGAAGAVVGAAAGAAAVTLVPSDAPSVPETVPAAPRIEVSFLVESDPPDATVTLDGKEVGRTPVRIALDPRQDHVLVVDRQGCESVVQLLATEEWRTGRSAQTRVRLQCQP